MQAAWRQSEPIVGTTVKDVDEAREVGGELFYPQRLTVLGRQPNFVMSWRAGRIGPVVLGDLRYNADVRIDCGELGTSYHVNLPLQGCLESRQGRVFTIATPERAAVYMPVGETSLTRWEAGSRQLCIKIDRTALESTLADILGRDIRRPILFDPDLDLRPSDAHSWVEQVLLLSNQLQLPDSLIHHPLVRAPLVKSVLTGLVAVARHPYRELLVEPADACRPKLINQAVDYIHAHAHEPITTVDIAKHCCCSVRALQEGFQKHLGQPPLRYLHSVRLQRAHEDLHAANPFDTTVSAIAHRWGFTHLSRFAAAYHARYGEPPSRTLRVGA